MKCQNCGAELLIRKRTQDIKCQSCGEEVGLGQALELIKLFRSNKPEPTITPLPRRERAPNEVSIFNFI